MMDDDRYVFDGRLQCPFSCLIAGSSNTGKTEFVKKLLLHSDRLINPTIKNVIYFYKIKSADLDHFDKNFKHRIKVTYVQGMPDNFDEYISSQPRNSLYLFDDLMADATNHKKLTELFTTRVHHNFINVILIFQDLFYSGSERKTFLRNANYLVLLNTPLDKSGVYAIAHKFMPNRVRLFMNIYENAVSKPFGYLFINGHRDCPRNARLRTNIFKSYQIVYEDAS